MCSCDSDGLKNWNGKRIGIESGFQFLPFEQGWEAKLLSQAGREILIKSVAQALPSYTIACFKLPSTLCHEIEMMICRFFWGQQGDNRKVHWVRWQDLCKPKSQGGMGLKSLPF